MFHERTLYLYRLEHTYGGKLCLGGMPSYKSLQCAVATDTTRLDVRFSLVFVTSLWTC